MSNNVKSGKYHLFVISAPSGGGKTTVINQIIALYPDIKYSVSITTRPPSPQEKNGKAYFFVSTDDFKSLNAKGLLLEFEEVHGNFYGTPKEPVEEVVANAGSMIFALDVKGGYHLKQLYPRTTLIFLLPPSMKILRQRLKMRGRETTESIKFRLQRAKREIAASLKYDYRVVNDDLTSTVQEVSEIIERVRKAD
jgi:guanylate kinase